METAGQGSTGKCLLVDYCQVRSRTLDLVAPLAVDDYGVQPMLDASPPKWHLAHTSWFFETFLLKAFCKGHVPFHPRYEYLFNSYFNGVCEQYPRTDRGFLSRPAVDEIIAYRQFVDERMRKLISHGLDDKALYLLLLGLNHEEQHQELLLTDLKCTLGCNPLRVAYRDLPLPVVSTATCASGSENGWLEQERGIYAVGCDSVGPGNLHDFAFDNETPCREVLLQAFALTDCLVTCEDFLAFIRDGGYQRPEFWLSDGWTLVQQENWQAPFYWEELAGEWQYYTLGGLRRIDPAAPVCHVSYYEADAYAHWAGCRLPSEFEWEVVARRFATDQGNFLEADWLTPIHADEPSFFGNVWEWTQSPYTPYPGFRPATGVVSEYNGKFMSSQMVLRGGSCFTPGQHIRPTYRNFFYPSARWQMSGLRLAKDLD